MLYIRLIAQRLNVSIEIANKIFDNMYIDFSESSERKIIREAKLTREALGL